MLTGGIDPINGGYSVWAGGKSRGYQPVTGGIVAGNVPEMLGNGSDVADNLRFIPIVDSIGLPTMTVQGMTIGGR
ncbi:MAG: metallopeptidase TldD-related protein [Anaerolineae bacterium]